MTPAKREKAEFDVSCRFTSLRLVKLNLCAIELLVHNQAIGRVETKEIPIHPSFALVDSISISPRTLSQSSQSTSEIFFPPRNMSQYTSFNCMMNKQKINVFTDLHNCSWLFWNQQKQSLRQDAMKKLANHSEFSFNAKWNLEQEGEVKSIVNVIEHEATEDGSCSEGFWEL